MPIVHPLAPDGAHFSRLPPLALYVHVPWCLRKCPYCDFNSHQLRGDLPEAEYVAALLADLESSLAEVWGRKVVSVFIGGGTPSLFSPRALDELLCGLRARLPIEPLAEITLEANPGTVEAGRFAEYAALGINRLSLGIQSFDADALAAIGRVHDAGQAHAAAAIALERFDNVNFDLMYALPGQDVAGARADLRAALAYAPQHLSAYHLTLEPNTAFHRAPPPLPDDDTAATMQAAIEEELAQAGYQHYETSAFARRGARCRHNLNYWLYGDYLGIGAGAHAKLSFFDRVRREARHRHPALYLEHAAAGGAVSERHEVSVQDLAFEFMMNALRLTGGFPLHLFTERTGLPLNAVLAPLNEAERRGLIERDAECVKPTERGRRFLNDLLELFLPG